MSFRRLLGLALVVATSCTSTGESRASEPASPPQRGSGLPRAVGHDRLPHFSRVAIIVLENKEYGEVIGSPRAPYINQLARRFGLATNFYGIRHPSLPNYLGLLGGSTFGITSDCTGCHVRATNLIDQLERRRISWKAYMEGMPRPCYRGESYGRYAKKHDPFMYFDDIANRPGRCHKIVPLRQLFTDMRAGRVPRLMFITPNECHDMHDCSVSVGDRFLRGLVPRVLNALGPNGVLFLTFDEGDTSRGCCQVARGGHIATIVAGPAVRGGTTSATAYDHYSILRTIESAWGLFLLRRAGCTCSPALTAFF